MLDLKESAVPPEVVAYPAQMDLQARKADLVTLVSLVLLAQRDVTGTLVHLVYQGLRDSVDQLVYLGLLVRLDDLVTEAFLVRMASRVTRDLRVSKDFLGLWDHQGPEAYWENPVKMVRQANTALPALAVMQERTALKAQSGLQDPLEPLERGVPQVRRDLAVSKDYQELQETQVQLERMVKLVYKELAVCQELLG